MQSFFSMAAPHKPTQSVYRDKKEVNSMVVSRQFLHIGQINGPNFIESKTLNLQPRGAIFGLFEIGLSLTPIWKIVNLSVTAFRRFLDAISAGECSWVVARRVKVMYFAVG